MSDNPQSTTVPDPQGQQAITRPADGPQPPGAVTMPAPTPPTDVPAAHSAECPAPVADATSAASSSDGPVGSVETVADAVPEHAARPAYHRVLAPDLARGFMLLFIALANIPFHLYYSQPPSGLLSHIPDTVPDAVAQFLTVMFIDARIFPMFAFLFGYGMVQFYQSRISQGLPDKAVRRMLRRRHLFMVLFGAVHFILLFEGDVVAPYGFIGLILVAIFFRRRDKTILIWALIGYGLLLALSTANLVYSLVLPDQAETTSQFVQTAMSKRTMPDSDYLAALPTKPVGFVASVLAQTLLAPFGTMIMLGWLAARRRYLEDAAQHVKLLRWVAVIGLGVACAVALPSALGAVGIIEPSYSLFAWGMLSGNLGCLGGLGYIALFALLAAKWQAHPAPAAQAVANVGARSLSSYLFQSVIFAPLLAAWGFSLGQDLGRFPAALIAIGTWLISVAGCWWLAQHQHRGPAETLLRRLTYGRYR